MKKTLGFLVIVLILGAAACVRYVPYRGPEQYPDSRYERDYGPTGSLDDAYFYNELEPYGIWVSFRPYGYVWIPRDVGYGWRPYTRGRWVWSDYGWTWVSLERWGWIAFHYGRWGWDRRLGWFWVPDIVWGPAWVGWRWGDSHIGWAPLPPGVAFVPGRGFGPHRWDIPHDHWVFIHGRYFTDRGLDRWVLPVERNLTIVNVTSLKVNVEVRDNRVHNGGVDLDHVRRLTNGPVERLSLKESDRAGSARIEGRDLVVYKPEVKKDESARPRRVLDEDRAERELSSEQAGRIYRPVQRGEPEELRENHDKERRLMRESQESEINAIRRAAESEKSKVQDPEEKRKVESRVSSRIAELRKDHEKEKAELEKRQKAEEEKSAAKKPPVKKKVPAEKR